VSTKAAAPDPGGATGGRVGRERAVGNRGLAAVIEDGAAKAGTAPPTRREGELGRAARACKCATCSAAAARAPGDAGTAAPPPPAPPPPPPRPRPPPRRCRRPPPPPRRTRQGIRLGLALLLPHRTPRRRCRLCN